MGDGARDGVERSEDADARPGDRRRRRGVEAAERRRKFKPQEGPTRT